MSHEEILKQAIEKAVKNGFRLPYIVEVQLEMRNIEKLVRYHQIDPQNCMDDTWSVMSLNGIIFSHEFARAFWGEEKVKTAFIKFPTGELDFYYKPIWQYHLQQMVIEDDPISYLEKFL